jgi:hypothetical protein
MRGKPVSERQRNHKSFFPKHVSSNAGVFKAQSAKPHVDYTFFECRRLFCTHELDQVEIDLWRSRTKAPDEVRQRGIYRGGDEADTEARSIDHLKTVQHGRYAINASEDLMRLIEKGTACCRESKWPALSVQQHHT